MRGAKSCGESPTRRPDGHQETDADAFALEPLDAEPASLELFAVLELEPDEPSDDEEDEDEGEDDEESEDEDEEDVEEEDVEDPAPSAFGAAGSLPSVEGEPARESVR